MYKYWVIFLFVINITNAQWENITLDIKSANLKDILVIDSSLIVSCGDNGIIKTTRDAGTNWITSKIDKLSRQFTALAKNDENIFIAGNSGALIKSNLIADKWEIIELGLKNNFVDIALIDNYGVIIGENGFLLLSSNKGNTWVKTKIIIDGTEIENNLLKVIFNKSGKLVIAGKKGLLVFSEDFGKSFKKLDLSINDNLTALTANEDGSILVGTDNIKLIHIDSTLKNFELINSNNLPHMFFSLLTIGDSIIVAGAVYNLDLVQTISYDFGKTWYFSNTYNTFAYGISNFLNQVYLCMNYGYIFKMDVKIKKYDSSFQYLGNIVEYGNEKVSYSKVSGNYNDKLVSFDSKNIYVTASKKIEWKNIFQLDRFGFSLRDVQFTSEGNIIALIDSQYYANGTNHYFPKIIKIIDENSFEILFESSLEMMLYKLIISHSNNFITAPGNLNILVSTNNGKGFDNLVIPDIQFFLDRSVGILSDNMLYFVARDKSSNYILYKTNDLQNFEKIQLPSKIKNVYLINKDIGFNLKFEYNENQYISKTTDGGKSFEMIFQYKLDGLNMLKDISFVDENFGVVCGQQGVVYYTDNGGENWYDIKNSVMDPTVKIYFPNKNELYVSDGQNIYKYVGELPNSVSDGDNGRNNSNISLSPNPISDFARLKLEENSVGHATISIVDILGNTTQLWSGELNGNNSLELDFSRFPTGFYSLIIDYGLKKEVVKIIKN